MRTSLVVASVGLAAALSWQALVVHYQYGGNWNGLFCTGALFQKRPPLPETVWTFADSYGYDGQWYHYIAHDPGMRRGMDQYLDAPRLRYHRILIPALASLLALGQDRFVDRAYIGLMLLSVFLGTLWISCYARLKGHSPWVGLSFVLAPGVLISIDRMTVDGALATACAGFIWLVEAAPGWPLFVLLAASPLVRDTGFLLCAAYVGALVLERRIRRAALFSTTVLPGVLWYAWVAAHTTPYDRQWLRELPLTGYIHQLFHPNTYPLAAPLAIGATILDYVAMAGVALALIWAVALLVWKRFTPLTIAIYGFAVLATLLPTGDFWYDPNGYARILTPLVLLLFAEGLRDWRKAMTFPMWMMTSRVGFQMAGMALRVVKAMIG